MGEHHNMHVPVKPNQTLLCCKAILNRLYDNMINVVLCISKQVHQYIQNLTTFSSEFPGYQ